MAGETVAPEESNISPYGEIQDWGSGRYMARREINANWAQYTPVNADGSRIIDEDGTPRRGVAIPRFEIFTQEDIVRFETEGLRPL